MASNMAGTSSLPPAACRQQPSQSHINGLERKVKRNGPERVGEGGERGKERGEGGRERGRMGGRHQPIDNKARRVLAVHRRFAHIFAVLDELLKGLLRRVRPAHDLQQTCVCVCVRARACVCVCVYQGFRVSGLGFRVSGFGFRV